MSALAVRVQHLAQDAGELGRDAVLDGRVPLVAHVEVPQDLADGFPSVLRFHHPMIVAEGCRCKPPGRGCSARGPEALRANRARLHPEIEQ